MSPENPNTEILLTTSGELTRPAVNALAHRGLADLEAIENADRWLALASEHFSRDGKQLLAVLDSQKIDFRTAKGGKPVDTWFRSADHRENMSAYIDCLRRASAAKPDYPKPLMDIAAAYLNGWGVATSRDEALLLLRTTAAVASPDDLWRMSFIIGKEVAGRDPWPEGMTEAEKWCRRAADQGHAGGQHSLGKMYSEGAGGLQKDYELAKYWFSKAAENGEFPPAEDELQFYWKE